MHQGTLTLSNGRRLAHTLATGLLVAAWLCGAAMAARKAPTQTIGTADAPVRVSAESAQRWTYHGETVIMIPGDTEFRSGATMLKCEGVILFLRSDTAGPPAVDIYAENNVRLFINNRSQNVEVPFYARISAQEGLIMDVPKLESAPAPERNPFYARALKTRYPDEELPWEPPTEEEVLFSAQDFQFRAQTYTSERMQDITRIVLHGDVMVTTSQARLFADAVVVWLERAPAADTEDGGDRFRVSAIYGRGAVTILSAEGSLRAEEFYLDGVTSEGLATNVVIRTEEQMATVPLSFQAEEVRQLDRQTLLARDGAFSTTHFIEPNWAIAGERIRVMQGRPQFGWDRDDEETDIRPSGPFATAPQDSLIVASRQNWVKVGPYRVFYIPFLAHDISSGGYLLRKIEIGSDSAFGFYIRTAWNPYDLGIYRNDWSDVTLHLDYYGDRGPAAGVDVEYEGPTRFGLFTAYYVNDSEDTEEYDAPIDDSDRGRVLWRHREFLDYGWRADFEFSYISDRNFLRTYFEQEFEEGKAQETLVYLRRIDDNIALTGLASVRINDWQTYVERLPELGFHWFGEPMWEDRLIYTNHTRASYLQLRIDNDLGMTDPDATARVDVQNELALPLDMGGWWLEPYVGGDMTFYSNDASGGSGSVRLAGEYGARASTNFHRTYDVVDEHFNINGIRHIIQPIVDYRHVFAVTEDPTKYTQYDAIDARDEFHHVMLRLRNRLQTKRGEPGRLLSEDFLLFDVEYNFFPGDEGRNDTLDDFLRLNARWYVNDYLELFSRDNIYNVSDSRLEVLNAGFKLTLIPPVSMTLEHDIVDVDTGPDHSITTFKLSYEPAWSRWRLDLEQRYDFEDNATPTSDRDEHYLTNIVALSRDLNGWRLILTLEFNDGADGGTSAGFRLQPTVFTSDRVEL